MVEQSTPEDVDGIEDAARAAAGDPDVPANEEKPRRKRKARE